jgi:hypothetical protein
MIQNKDVVHRAQVNDRALMAEFHCVGYQGKELVALNIVHCFQNLFHLLNISKCDGITLDKFVVLDYSEISISYIFPREEPTPSIFCIGKNAICHLCYGTVRLPYCLGPYLRNPYLSQVWFTTLTADVLYQNIEDEAHPNFNSYTSSLGSESFSLNTAGLKKRIFFSNLNSHVVSTVHVSRVA